MFAMGPSTGPNLGVQEGLSYVEGRGHQTSYGAGHATRHQVDGGVVPSVGVERVRRVFVDHEVQRLERNVHEELRGVGTVEGFGAFGAEDPTSAFRARFVRGLVDLHTLLDDCGRGERSGGQAGLGRG